MARFAASGKQETRFVATAAPSFPSRAHANVSVTDLVVRGAPLCEAMRSRLPARCGATLRWDMAEGPRRPLASQRLGMARHSAVPARPTDSPSAGLRLKSPVNSLFSPATLAQSSGKVSEIGPYKGDDRSRTRPAPRLSQQHAPAAGPAHHRPPERRSDDRPPASKGAGRVLCDPCANSVERKANSVFEKIESEKSK